MRIAFFGPLNPLPTGISDYSEELLPALASLAEIDVYVSGFTPSNPCIRRHFKVCECDEFAARHAQCPYDVNLYQMGNSIHHDEIHRMLTRYPGIVVLHDTILHHFFLELTYRDSDPLHYLREMLYDHGSDGMARGMEVLAGTVSPPFFDHPLLGRTTQVSLGVIVHSRYAQHQVEAYRNAKVAVVPPHINLQPEIPSARLAALRARHGISSECILFGSYGTASPPKRLQAALRAFARLRDQVPSTHFLIVGPVSPPGWLDPIVVDLNLQEAVTITGAVPFDDFLSYIAATDICLNLRYPTAGESSASVLRVMGAGRPVIVSDVGSFSEFPDHCVLKVPVNSTEERYLFDQMQRLVVDEELRRNLGARGREYVATKHSPQVTASAYIDAIERILSRFSVPREPSHSSLTEYGAADPSATMIQHASIKDKLQREVAAELGNIGLA